MPRSPDFLVFFRNIVEYNLVSKAFGLSSEIQRTGCMTSVMLVVRGRIDLVVRQRVAPLERLVSSPRSCEIQPGLARYSQADFVKSGQGLDGDIQTKKGGTASVLM